MHRSIRRTVPIAAAAATLWVGLAAPPSPAGGDPPETAYRRPDPVLAEIVTAPQTPLVSLSPDRAWLAVVERPNLPSVAELAERELRLGGLRIKPATSGPSRGRHDSGLSFLRVADGAVRPVAGLPARPRLQHLRWSPDGRRVGFTHTAADGIELWVAEVASGAARRLVGPRLNLAAGASPEWLADGGSLICTMIPADRGPEPAAPAVPAGPVIQESLGRAAPARTYQDLLRNPHDEALFEHYLTSRLARVALDGRVEWLGPPEMVRELDPSPDGRYLLVRTLHRPFSYLVPVSRFPVRVTVRTLAGGDVRELEDCPLQEEIPIAFGSVTTCRREFGWRSDAGATLAWAEARDGGDAGREADVRDEIFLLAAPFDGPPVSLATLDLRAGGVTWGHDGLALVGSWWWKTRTVKTWKVRPGSPDRAPEPLLEYSWQDRYRHPGSPLTRPNAAGRPVLVPVGGDASRIYMIGDGASEEGDRPFLDVLDTASGETRRLFRSEAPYYERPVTPLDDRGRTWLTRRESIEEPPNYFVRDLGKRRRAGDALRAVTAFPHPTPQLLGVRKEQIRYKRADGLDLTGTLYLPKGHTAEAGPLPALLWAYPEEFKSADAAGQVTDSPHRFVRVGWWSPVLWVTQGFAVLDDPSMPIVGEGDGEPNETFVEQLVSSARAAVGELVRRGVGDRDRMAIGGHSYGAFMAANLLAHSDLFAAGVARSGAYNRTLTPFGFQAEERTLWEAPSVYFTMSPFMHAEKIDEPLLLIHGDADNNSGTYPMQSERFYNALKGLGATTRLVMLPHESHGYRAEESILHMLWETERWLETHVEHAAGEGG